MKREYLLAAWLAALSFSGGAMPACRAAEPVPATAINTLASWAGGVAASFGDVAGQNPGGTTFGQTFRVEEGDGFLSSLSFIVQGYAPHGAPEVCTFQACIMAWNGSHPIGPVLYSSSPLVMPEGFFPTITFNLPLNNVGIIADTDYVVFFTANNFLNGIRSDAAMGSVADIYPGGSFVSQTGGNSFNDLLNQNWDPVAANFADLAVRLDFTPVPEPATLLLPALGALVWVWRRSSASRVR
jgi:hypothetical protein